MERAKWLSVSHLAPRLHVRKERDALLDERDRSREIGRNLATIW